MGISIVLPKMACLQVRLKCCLFTLPILIRPNLETNFAEKHAEILWSKNGMVIHGCFQK